LGVAQLGDEGEVDLLLVLVNVPVVLERDLSALAEQDVRNNRFELAAHALLRHLVEFVPGRRMDTWILSGYLVFQYSGYAYLYPPVSSIQEPSADTGIWKKSLRVEEKKCLLLKKIAPRRGGKVLAF
jgi:hypothetical protein